jgi:hypothetical protein
MTPKALKVHLKHIKALHDFSTGVIRPNKKKGVAPVTDSLRGRVQM